MKWFEGEISTAIQKAISEQKLFVVFVKDDGEQSKSIEDLWEMEEVKEICTDELSVAINLTLGSVACEQFGKIYPIICVPAIFFINNDGIPSAIFPYMEKEEFVEKLNNVFQTFKDEKANKASQVDTTTETTASSETISDDVIDGADSPVEAGGGDEGLEQTTTPEHTEDSESRRDKAEALLEKARALKAQKEKEEAKEKERRRRDEGRELSQGKRDQAERQAKQLADEITKRRAEEKAARERVKQQIKQDRADKEARYEEERKAKESEKQAKSSVKEAAAQEAKRVKTDSKMTRIQFRLPDGSTASKEFNSDAKFLVVEDYATKVLVSNLPCLRLTTVFPKHEYTVDDSLKSLRELGLAPSASIIVSPGKSASASTPSSLNPANIIMTFWAALFAILTWFFSFFSTSTNNAPSAEQSQAQETATTNQSDGQIRDAAVRRRNVGGTSGSNIRRLYDDKPDDEDNATWNGNSTQQM